MCKWRKRIPQALIILEKEYQEKGGRHYYQYIDFMLDGVCLDGEYTSSQLREIADAMDANPILAEEAQHE